MIRAPGFTQIFAFRRERLVPSVEVIADHGRIEVVASFSAEKGDGMRQHGTKTLRVGKSGMGKMRAVLLIVMASFSFVVLSAISSITTSATAAPSVQIAVQNTVSESVSDLHGQSGIDDSTSVSLMRSGYQIVPMATPGSGPEIKTQSEADASQNRRKIVAGVAAVVLLGLVIWGRHVRKKRSSTES